LNPGGHLKYVRQSRTIAPVTAEAPAPWASLAKLLRADSPIAVLEQFERQLKEVLARELTAPPDGARIRALASFQKDLGFLLKYKSYAVKAASPLGYSVFLQRPGEGFSFQQHVTHKTEIFYILDVLPGGYVFLCDFAEWREIYRRETFLSWLKGAADPRYERFRFVPRPGDVVVIDKLSVVHSVVGCALAEFATVSTDMVDRLYDQNEGAPIPAEFSRVFAEERIGQLVWPGESSCVTLGASGWSRSKITPETVTGGRRTSFGGGGKFVASSLRFDAGASSDITSDARCATSLHIVSGSGQVILGAADEVRCATPPALSASAGDLFLVAPGAHYGFVNDGAMPLVVAEHRIDPTIAFV
jgi:mannose-6-phosphate isomerase-like protein (cupin superfamily)